MTGSKDLRIGYFRQTHTHTHTQTDGQSQIVAYWAASFAAKKGCFFYSRVIPVFFSRLRHLEISCLLSIWFWINDLEPVRQKRPINCIVIMHGRFKTINVRNVVTIIILHCDFHLTQSLFTIMLFSCEGAALQCTHNVSVSKPFFYLVMQVRCLSPVHSVSTLIKFRPSIS